MAREPNHVIHSSDGTSLHFTSSKMFKEYQAECRALDDKYYALIRADNGVWATNQGKFVRSADQLTSWDITTMEDRFNGTHAHLQHRQEAEEGQADREGT